MRAALAVLAIVALLNPNAFAQPEPSSVAIAFDGAGTIYQGIVPGFAQPTPLYLLILNLSEPISGYEIGITVSGPGSEEYIVTSDQPGLGIDLFPEDPLSYIVGLAECTGTAGSNFLVTRVWFAYFDSPQAPLNTLVCTGPPNAGVPSIPGFPSYYSCDSTPVASGVHPDNSGIEGVPDGCAILNCTLPACTVATESSSWCAVKASY